MRNTPSQRFGNEAPVFQALVDIVGKITHPRMGAPKEEIVSATVRQIGALRSDPPSADYTALMDALERIQAGDEPPLPGVQLDDAQRALLVQAIDEYTSQTSEKAGQVPELEN
jgi:hypothetical protein